MIGPYEVRLCEWCGQPVAECECDDLDDVADADCPCGNGCWDEPDTGRPIVTIDTGGLT